MEDVGSCRAVGRIAGAAVPARRANAALAQRVRVVRPRAADLGRPKHRCGGTAASRCAARFCLGYLCGVLWYCGNCYWVRDTMMHYGDMPTGAPTLLLLGFSLVLGLYFGLFGLAVALVRRATGSPRWALAAAPFLWVALELAAARITSVPWDQLGYSQVDNGLVNQLAPWTGVYGISFVLVAVNALLAYGWVSAREGNEVEPVQHNVCRCYRGVHAVDQREQRASRADSDNRDRRSGAAQPRRGRGQQLERRLTGIGTSRSSRISPEKHCKAYIAGIPQTGAPKGEIVCPPYSTHPDLVVWPESPAPFFELDPRVASSARQCRARRSRRRWWWARWGWMFRPTGKTGKSYNSALVIGADGARVGRYDKIHLVPFGEYVPFRDLLFFAHKLTGRVARIHARERSQGLSRRMATATASSSATKSVFADEVRAVCAQLGAEVLVNISDDGWYGDTSAPWQHLNMARMRAIENRRWLLRDTNNGVTAVIDPYGRVRQSIPRHQVDALPAQFGFRDDITFYTAHGDVFAWALCHTCYRACAVGRLRVRLEAQTSYQSQVLKSKRMSLNDLEFAYAPVRDQVRDLREYL